MLEKISLIVRRLLKIITKIATALSFLTFYSLSQEMQSTMSGMDMTSSMNQSVMNFNGSGTGWLPESSSMFVIHSKVSNWSVMNHGSAYIRYTDQNANHSDKRGERAYDAPNWFMTMWDRAIKSKNQLRLRGMLSFDPLTEGSDGYPLLFQTGEVFKGKPLIDRQHPHDLFMELSATWFYKLTDQNTLFSYFAYPGEPALGPVTYMHRPSAEMNVDAPLGHHWQDATHITFGVFTLGIILNKLKIDGSIFTGREPDEHRWNFAPPRFDSYSGRVSYRFTPQITAQISSGFLRSPEILHPNINQIRISGSIETSFLTSRNAVISSSIIYGSNIEKENGSSHLTNTILAEIEFLTSRIIPYGRYEFAQRKGEDLGITNAQESIFNIHAFTLGSALQVAAFKSFSFFAGAQGTMNVPDKNLRSEYGKLPLSYEIFIRVRPSTLTMSSMEKSGNATTESEHPFLN